MFAKLELTRMAQALASHSGARMDVIARNVANADTPGYRARDVVVFSDTYSQDDGMRTTGLNILVRIPSPLLREL